MKESEKTYKEKHVGFVKDKKVFSMVRIQDENNHIKEVCLRLKEKYFNFIECK